MGKRGASAPINRAQLSGIVLCRRRDGRLRVPCDISRNSIDIAAALSEGTAETAASLASPVSSLSYALERREREGERERYSSAQDHSWRSASHSVKHHVMGARGARPRHN